jgi:hypothetical protein
MYNETNPGLRFAALVGAGSVTASILFALALLAAPTIPVEDPPTKQELAAIVVPPAFADVSAAERLHITVAGTRLPSSAAAPAVAKRLHITVVGVRDPNLVPASAIVRAQAECPPDAAHGQYAGSAAPAVRPSKV